MANCTQICKLDISSSQSELLGLIDVLFSCAIVNIIAVLGIMGNVLNIAVLCHHDLNETTTILLLAMSTTDMLFLLTSIPRRFVCVLSKFCTYAAKVLNAFATAYLWMPNRYCGLVSSGLVTLIALERFVAVHFPLSVASMINRERMLLVIWLMCVFWATLSAPFFALYDIDWNQEADASPHIVLASFIEKDTNGYNTLNVSIAIIRGPVSVLVIVVCSTAIVARLYDATRKMAEGLSAQRSTRDLRVLRMLLVVTSVYAVIGIPLSIPYIVYYVSPAISVKQDGTLTDFAILMEIVNDLLYVLNASVNFVIYVTMSTKFYTTYIKLLSKFCSKFRSR